MKTRAQKNQIIEKLVKKINNYPSLIFAEYQGLTVAQMDELRGQCASLCRSYDEPDFQFEVVKNSLLMNAFKKTQYTQLLKDIDFKGPLAVLWSKNFIDAAKVVVTFAKEHQNLKLKFGISGGKVVSDKEIVTISQLPPKEVLVGKLLGILKSPMINLINVINAPLRNLVLILNQKAKTADSV